MTMEIAIEQPYLEYLHCLECNHILALVMEHDGRTAIELAFAGRTEITIFRASLTCPNCGAKREFVSIPLSAIRLGIVDSG